MYCEEKYETQNPPKMKPESQTKGLRSAPARSSLVYFILSSSDTKKGHATCGAGTTSVLFFAQTNPNKLPKLLIKPELARPPSDGFHGSAKYGLSYFAGK